MDVRRPHRQSWKKKAGECTEQSPLDETEMIVGQKLGVDLAGML
jgi:hypothetical protein